MTSQSEAHRIARSMIERHGVDRYPDLRAQVLKLVAEVGELAEAVLTGSWENSRRELGQVAVTLHLTADKLGQLPGTPTVAWLDGAVDVLDAMRVAVALDPRKHQDGTLRGAVGERPTIAEEASAATYGREVLEQYATERPVTLDPIVPPHVVAAVKAAYAHRCDQECTHPDEPLEGEQVTYQNSGGYDPQPGEAPPAGPDTPSGLSAYAGPTQVQQHDPRRPAHVATSADGQVSVLCRCLIGRAHSYPPRREVITLTEGIKHARAAMEQAERERTALADRETGEPE